MQLITPVKCPDFPSKISYSDKILSIGSCFSVHMAQKMGFLGYDVLQNPTGITYSAASISRTLKMVHKPDSLHDAPVNHQNSLYSHPDFHGSYNQLSEENLLQITSDSLTTARNFLQKTSFVFLTLGTSVVFRSRETGHIVNNCHKLPSTRFDKEVLTIIETVRHMTEALDLIMEMSQADKVHFVLTVSPIRHVKNGLIEDRRSKSIALLAIHQLVSERTDCHYFPSYEIMTDELRDYRFYKSDLIHPSETAIDLIYDRFSSSLLDPREADLRKQLLSIRKRQEHRPLFPDTAEHQQFLKKLEENIITLKAAYPTINIE